VRARVQVQNSNGTLTTKGLGIIPPGCIGPPKHIHPSYSEEFTIVEGSFYFYLGNKKQMINSGEVVVVPPGTAHTFQPANTSQVNSFLVEAKPAGKLEEVIKTVWALGIGTFGDAFIDKLAIAYYIEQFEIANLANPPKTTNDFVTELLNYFS
jgi:quercetin dioxygenase-like cupin family protein